MSHAPAGKSALRLSTARALLLLATMAAVPATAFAQATPKTRAGSLISNTATASFDTGGGSVTTINSNTSNLRVDELLDVVVTINTATVPTTPGALNQLLTFEVTNTGNGQEAFRLSTIANAGGDQYDPIVTQVFLDSNGNGVFDDGTDQLYVQGANDPSLAPDGKIAVFVFATTPNTTIDNDRGFVSLVAAATTGTGPAGTVYAGRGDDTGNGAGDAVVGSTEADGTAQGTYIVSAATVALVKSAVVTNQFGGDDAVPGATITYTIVATATGSGSVADLTINDNVPTDTTYQPGSITLQTATLTDAVDSDAGSFDGTRVSVVIGTLPGGQSRTVTFKSTIK